MLDLRQYASLGAALKDALERWPNETCLIEADRDREKVRLTYSDFKEMARPLCRALEDADFKAGDRAAIIMTNQSKWLISAYSIFFCGGVLVPLDYKLTAAEHLQLLAHSKARFLVVEYYLWRAITQSREFAKLTAQIVLVTEAPAGADLRGAYRWEEFRRKGEPQFVARQREDTACIVYSSGTGGRPKGCVLTHDSYLEQCTSLTAWYPFWPGVRYLSILPTNHAIDFMVGFIGPFVCGACVVHLRTLRPEFVRDAFVRYRITYVSLVPMVLKNLERGLRAKFDELKPRKAVDAGPIDRDEQNADAGTSAGRDQPASAAASTQGVWRRTAGADCWRSVYGSFDVAVFLRSGNSGDVRVRADGSLHGGDAQRSETVSRRYGGQAAARNRSARAESGCRRDRRSCGAEPRGHVALSGRLRSRRRRRSSKAGC